MPAGTFCLVAGSGGLLRTLEGAELARYRGGALMDLAEELRRVEQPPFCASRVVRLSPEEIERLQEAGEITPPERIPQMHGCPRDFSSPRWGRAGFAAYEGSP